MSERSNYTDSPPIENEYTEKFQYFVDELNSIQAKRQTPNYSQDDDPQYIDSGSDRSVYKFTKDGKVYTAKFLHASIADSDEYKSLVTDRTIGALIQGKDIANLEQLVAYDPSSGIIVTTYMPGEMLAYMSVKDKFRYIKKCHLIQLDNTLSAMHKAGVTHHNIGGVLFDREEGFSFCDYEKIGGHTNVGEDLISVDDFIWYAFTDWEKKDRYLKYLDWEFSKFYIEPRTTGIRALQRYLMTRKAKKVVRQK